MLLLSVLLGLSLSLASQVFINIHLFLSLTWTERRLVVKDLQGGVLRSRATFICAHKVVVLPCLVGDCQLTFEGVRNLSSKWGLSTGGKVGPLPGDYSWRRSYFTVASCA